VESLSLEATTAAVASGAGLSVSYNTATGELTITGSATKAIYETVLRGIQYNNTSDAPITTDRVVSVVATDEGDTSSAARISVIKVTQLRNDAPVNTVPGAQTTNEDTALMFSVAGSNAISIADDAGTNPVQVTLTGTNGVITLAGIAGLAFTAGDGSADVTMTFTGTVAAINAALNGLSFSRRRTSTARPRFRSPPTTRQRRWRGASIGHSGHHGGAVNDGPVNTAPGAQATRGHGAGVLSNAIRSRC
jgi:hypothetical protein